MQENTKGFGAENAPNLIFTCSTCGSEPESNRIALGCAYCEGKGFKVARQAIIGLPLMEDPSSQGDPYREQKTGPGISTDVGTQFDNFGGEGTPTESVGGPNDRAPQDEHNSNPDGRPLPSDGYGSDISNQDYSSQVADDSPLNEPTQQSDVNPFNFMRSTESLKADDPYELIRKRRYR